MDPNPDARPAEGILTLRREASWSARLRAFQMLIDGQPQGTIREGETSHISLTSGPHRLRLRVDWCRSPEVEFQVGPGEAVAYACRASYLSPLDPLIRPRRYIELLPSTTSLAPQRTAMEDFALRFMLTVLPLLIVITVLVVVRAGALAAGLFGVLWFLIVMSVPIRKKAAIKTERSVAR